MNGRGRRSIIAAVLIGAVLAFASGAIAGFPEDLKQAKESLEQVRKKGEQGDVQAQFVLGFMYRDGRVLGVPQDYIEAAMWYLLAADQGNIDAMHELGLMYFDGEGVPKDYIAAYIWLNLAAAGAPKGDTTAAKARDDVARRMTRTQIAEAQKLAREWVRK
jgi:TPR repeat protein